MSTLYDTIGLGYVGLRQPDPRIAQQIHAALKGAKTVLNVGAGAGSYEPMDKQITAVEPSKEMIAQRPPSNTTVIQAKAENLPFDDNSFDAAMALLTIHHWSDRERGVQEMRRTARGKIVFLTFDPSFRGLWLADYLPALVPLDEAQMPPMEDFEKWLGPVKISAVPVPHDCSDGFLASYWRRPAAYLDAHVRAGSSVFWALGDISEALAKLRADLNSGRWEERHADLLGLETLDCGYRLVETI